MGDKIAQERSIVERDNGRREVVAAGDKIPPDAKILGKQKAPTVEDSEQRRAEYLGGKKKPARRKAAARKKPARKTTSRRTVRTAEEQEPE